MLWRMIKQSKAQFTAVLVIILVGIAIFTAISLAGVNLEDSKNQYYKENAFADLSITVQKMPASLISDLQSVEGVALAEGRLTAEVPFIGEDEERVNVKLLSIPSAGQNVNILLLKEGRFIRNVNEEVIVLSQFAEGRGIVLGDEIAVQVNGVRCELEVVGIAYSPEFIYLIESAQSMMPAPENYGVIYVDEALAMQLMGMSGAYNEVFFLYENDKNGNTPKEYKEEDIIDDIEKLAEPYGLTYTTKQEHQLSNALIGEEINSLKKSGVALPMMFLLVAALVIAMMLSRMVKRDRIKIGVMKAIGYSDATVLGHYVKYSLAAGLMGGIAGILVGFMIADYMTGMYADFFEIPRYGMKIYWNYIFGGVLLSCSFCMAFGAYGARGAMKIVPAESMQSESPKEGRRILLESFPAFWKKLSFSRKLIMKNIFRNKRRSLFVLLGVSLTFGTIMFTMSMPDVIDDMIVKQFEEVQTMDYNVSFAVPVLKTTEKDMEYELAESAYVEGRIEYPFEISIGNKVKTVTIIGIKEDSHVMNLTNLDGQAIYPVKDQILLTENLANALGVGIGERVLVESYIPDGKDCYLVVQDIVKQMMGMNAYMNIEDLGKNLLEPGIINGVYINSDDSEVVSTLRKMDNVSTILSSGDMQSMYMDYMCLIIMMLGALVLLSGILGFCIVYNATIVSLGEREMEFSSLRVMGFAKNEIFRMMLSENILISIAGVILGIPMGFGMTSYSSAVFSNDLYTLYMTPTMSAALSSLFFTALFLLVAQFATYEKIRKLDFLRALKNRAS